MALTTQDLNRIYAWVSNAEKAVRIAAVGPDSAFGDA